MLNIDVVTGRKEDSDQRKLKSLQNIFFKSKADLLLFPGSTIGNAKKLYNIDYTKFKGTAILEAEEINSFLGYYWLFKVSNSEIQPMMTSQLFNTSGLIKSNEVLGEMLVHTLANSRTVTVKGKKILVLQCGENNVLRVPKDDGNIDIRLSPYQKQRFKELLRGADIIFNPTHTANTRPLYERRHQYLSMQSKMKTCITTSNKKKASNSPLADLDSLHQVYVDRHKRAIPEPQEYSSEYFAVFRYSIA